MSDDDMVVGGGHVFERPEDDDDLHPDQLESYVVMMQEFLPTLFDLPAMGKLFYKHLNYANMNTEQAATLMHRLTLANLKKVVAKDELSDHDLTVLVNAICGLLHMRAARIQMVAQGEGGMSEELRQEVQDIINLGLSQQETHRRVSELKKRRGL